MYMISCSIPARGANRNYLLATNYPVQSEVRLSGVSMGQDEGRIAAMGEVFKEERLLYPAFF